MLPAMDFTEQLQGLMPLCGTLGMRAVRFEPEAIELEMDWTPERCTSNGLLHGGALMALADSAGGACAVAHPSRGAAGAPPLATLPEGATGTSTIESKSTFLGAVRAGAVRALARPLHIGSTTIVV